MFDTYRNRRDACATGSDNLDEHIAYVPLYRPTPIAQSQQGNVTNDNSVETATT